MKLLTVLSASVLLTSISFAQMVAEPLQAPVPATAPTTNPAEAAAAKDALLKYNTAVENADVPALIASIDAKTDLQKRALALMGRLTTASHDLYLATVDKYGAKSLETEGVNKDQFQGAFPALPVEELQVKVSGDTAALTTQDNQPLPFTLVKKDGVWKLDAGFLPPFTEQQLADQSLVLDAAIKAMSDTKADVTAGTIKSPDEVLVLMQHRAQKAIRAVQMKQMEDAMKGAATQPGAGAAPGPINPQVPDDIMAPQ